MLKHDWYIMYSFQLNSITARQEMGSSKEYKGKKSQCMSVLVSGEINWHKIIWVLETTPGEAL